MNQQKSFEDGQAGSLYLVPPPIGNLEDMKERLFELEPPQGGEKRKSPFWDMMARESQVSAQEAYNYSGIYISYSL